MPRSPMGFAARHRDKGDLDRAIADFSQAIKIDRAWPMNDPGSFRVYVNRGTAALSMRIRAKETAPG